MEGETGSAQMHLGRRLHEGDQVAEIGELQVKRVQWLDSQRPGSFFREPVPEANPVAK
jgi:hypothetical protein